MFPMLAYGRQSPIEPRFQHSCILELRKEKSRDAARSRRGKENYEFYELAKMLPLPGAITSQLDKASIIRLTISYLKLRDFSSHGDPPWSRDGPPPNKSVKGGPPRRRSMTAVAMEIFEASQGTHILQSLDGFAFALSNDGRFLYISETVSIYLGLSQVEMAGSCVFDYVHQQDHPELAEQLGLCLPHSTSMPSPSSGSEAGAATTSSATKTDSPSVSERVSGLMQHSKTRGVERAFHIRMKSTLTKRGVHVKTSGYRVVHIIGHMRSQFSFSLTRKHPPPILGFVAVALALPPPTINELKIDNDMFVMRVSPDFKVVFCEPRIADLMDMTPDDLVNKNLYSFIHAEDLNKMRKAHSDLLTKGQVLSDYFRIMNVHGGQVWLQMCATIIFNNKNSDEESIICIIYVLSGIEYANCVMSSSQLAAVKNKNSDNTDNSDSEAQLDHSCNNPSSTTGTSERTSTSHHNLDHSHLSKHMNNNEPIGNLETFRYPQNGDGDMDVARDFLLDDSTSGCYADDDISDKLKDIKNSRRKMGRPRKRKRDPSPDNHPQVTDIDASSHTSLSPLHNPVTLTPSQSNVPTSPTPNPGTAPAQTLRSPLPEDLSVKTVSAALGSPDHHNQDIPQRPGSGTVSNVRDLEEAMSKHLPQNDEPNYLGNNYTSGQFAKQRSTIQWIGSQQQTNNDTLPASTLLRHLYANRESVIRTNVYNQSRPQYYGDIQSTVLGTNADSSQFSVSQLTSGTSKSQSPNVYHNSAYTSSIADAYGMVTPVADKYTAFSESSYTDSNSNQLKLYNNDGVTQTMPIRPQVYPLSTPSHAHTAYDRGAASQFAKSSYYHSSSNPYSAFTHPSSGLTEDHYRQAKSAW
ncbi:protein trachealess-like [Tubulanus polymorphus]|uniref:protein trachealess-like n=1 Tax=Tubulanus polymorphus TaxID=672921 RepID=UPI003DA44F8B